MNWAGNVAYGAGSTLEPRSIDALQEIVRAAPSLPVVGSRRSFSEIVAAFLDRHVFGTRARP